ncbi:MAG: hypothetical protein AB7V58_11710 [Solirubrobacterales bacterium]
MDLRSEIASSLGVAYDGSLVEEMLDAHEELKQNFYLGGLRLAEVEGGRFAEAAFRLLQEETTGTFDPLGNSIDTEAIIRGLANAPRATFSDSIRLHIPRALRVIYDVRNNRDAAHLADGIDPNLQDSTLVATTADWVLAEFVRLHHNVPADRAQEIVEDLVQRKAPVIEEFGDYLKLLNPGLPAGQQCLVLLYQRGPDGADFADLESWVSPSARANLRRTVDRLVHDKAFVHEGDGRLVITGAGRKEVETRRLLELSGR